MNLRALLVSPLAFSLLVAVRPAAEKIEFRPLAGLTLVETVRAEVEGENERTSDEGSSTMRLTEEFLLVVTDEIQAAKGGRTTKLRRTQDELSSKSSSEFQGPDGMSVTGSSDLENATVTFEWSEDEQEYAASSDEVEADVLEDLPYDLDFAALLPSGDVSEGDEWEVDTDAFANLTNPWPKLPWKWDLPEQEGTVTTADDEPEVDESRDGEVTATYAGTREVDGVTLAVVTLEGEIEVETTVGGSSDGGPGSATFHQEWTAKRSIEGELLWNVAGGYLHSLRIVSEEESQGSLEDSFSVFGEDFIETEQREKRTSSSTFTASFEPARKR